jgi:hypothetical protein
MAADELASSPTVSHRVPARNDAEQSENKIHDDGVAQQYGFRGGLVPGVTVYGYLTWLPASAWGRVWLEGGGMSVRLVKPVYDGDEVTVLAAPDGADALTLSAINQFGDVCATGGAWLPGAASSVVAVSAAGFAGDSVPEPVPAPQDRPPAGETTLMPGTVLGSVSRSFDAADRAKYLDLLSDDLALYESLGVAHPGSLIRAANEVLSRTVRLGPWIHVSSETTHLGLVPDGSTVTTYGRIVDRYERKGHQFVDLDVVSVVDGAPVRPVLSVHHTAIYSPRIST